MTIKLNWWLLLAFLALCFSVFALLGWYAREQTYQSAMNTRLVAYSGNLSRSDVMSILESARLNHQYYVDHSDKQNVMTGNTAFNQMWVNNYLAIEAYLLRGEK